MKTRTLGQTMQEMITYSNRGKHIFNQVEKNKSVVYGGQAIKKQIGFLARHTKDYDVLSRKPKKSARQLERTLDNKSDGDYYYATPSIFHKGTYKVYHKGVDRKKGTRDDIGIADFTKMRAMKTKTIDGVKFAQLSEVVKDKRKALADKQYAFRHKKDREDINRIKVHRKLKRDKI